MILSPEILCGQTHDHVMANEEGILVHLEMAAAYTIMKTAAAKEGFELKIASGFRDFEAQKRIWDLKCQGKRPVLDAKGNPLNHAALKDEAIVLSILRWSALPGASRHHWGTDIDVFDAAQTKDGYVLQLVPAEVAPGGKFEKLNKWLDANIESFGFFRPYAEDRGGVSPEWWHLSYAPIAESYYKAHTLDLLKRVIQDSEIEKKEIVLAKLPGIYRQYVTNIVLPKGKKTL